MKENEYKCDQCGNIYEFGWSEEEAEKEMKENWGDISKEDMAIVCDDCYDVMNPNLPENKNLAKKHGFIKPNQP